jgi:hypothetical protein
VDREGDRFVFQGDNNDFLDPDKPVLSELVGRRSCTYRRVAIWLSRLSSPPAIAGFASPAERRRRDRHRPAQPRKSTSLKWPAPSRRCICWTGMAPQLRTAAAAVAGLGVLGIVLSGFAYNKPLTTLSVPQGSGSAGGNSMTFGYTASVPASAAYDGTTVEAPLPVFRAADRHGGRDLRIIRGAWCPDGRRELSTDNGWSTSVPLAAAQPSAPGTTAASGWTSSSWTGARQPLQQ